MLHLDEFARRVERLMTEVVAELEQPIDWKMGDQTFENPHARILMHVNGEKPWFQIDREEEGFNTSDEELKERMRGVTSSTHAVPESQSEAPSFTPLHER